MEGKKLNKSAIRRDWVKTKSRFCYKDTAKEDFYNIISSLHSDHILISYSTDGLIPFTDMLEILSEKGKLDIVLSEYVKFRGGKQALTSEVRNIEFVLMVDTTQKGSTEDIVRIQNSLCVNRAVLAMKKTINPLLAESIGYSYKTKVNSNLKSENILYKYYQTQKIEFVIGKNKIVDPFAVIKNIVKLSPKNLEEMLKDLEYITNITKEDEFYIVINDIYKLYLKEKYEEANERFKTVPYLLSKFNNKKAFNQSLRAIISLLKILNKTPEVWVKYKILDTKAFAKLEKLILLKLNYESDNEAEVEKDKKIISHLYEMFLDVFVAEKTVIKSGISGLIKEEVNISR